MRTLLQDGLQAHMPSPPEKRLLINSILAPTDPRVQGTRDALLERVERALAEEGEIVERRLAETERRLPAWEARRPFDLGRAQAERLADNVTFERRFAGALHSLRRLPVEERKKHHLETLVQFQADGKRTLLELARRVEFDQGRAVDLRAQLRGLRLLEKHGYVTCVYRETFGRSELAHQLRRVGVEPGDTLLVHSSLAALGPLEDGPETIFGALREAVGPNGTIAFPAFGFNTVREYPDAPFDVARTPSRVGALSDLFWRQAGVARSRHPSHGLAAVGPHAEALVKDTLPYGPFDLRGSFGRLYALDAKVLMLGCGLAPNTALHAIEDWANLPSMKPETYHYLDDNGTRREIRYDKLPVYPREFYTGRIGHYERLLRESDRLTEDTVGLALSFSMRVRDLLDLGMEEVRGRRFGILFDTDSERQDIRDVLRKLRDEWVFPDDAMERMRRLSAGKGERT